MSSNSSGPASPFNADEAEELAAQFRPVWDVDEAAPPPEAPPAEPPPAPQVPLAKATMRWAPGNGPQGFPAPAPPAPLPAPAPRKRREAPTPEVRELTGEEKMPVSSDGAVAMAVVTGPVVPRKAAEVTVPQEPSIVVKDVAAAARAVADEDTRRQEEEQRRRQTVRLDDLRKDPALAEMYAKYENTGGAAPEPEPAKPTPAKPAPTPVKATPTAPDPRVERRAAPLPEPEEEVALPTNNNRKIVFGAVGVAALIALLGIAKATLSPDKDDSLPTPPVATATKTAPEPTADTTSKQGASAVGAATPDTTATNADTTAAATAAPTPAKTPTPPSTASDPPAAVPKKDTKVEPKAKAVAPPPPAQTSTPAPPPADKKKPATKGGIIRDVPF